MGQVILEQRHGTNIISDWPEAFMNRNKYRGKIAVMTLEKIKRKTTARHDFYHNGQAAWMLKNHQGETNTYISLNAFGETAGVLERKESNVVQIRCIGIDVDCYSVGMTVEQAEREIYKLVVSGVLPNPNLLIYSGNGLQVVYSIEGGVPAKLSWLTKDITAQLALKTSHIGSDMSCIDIARVFRMPGTVNEKPGKGRKETSCSLWRQAEYDLSELYAYCEPFKKRTQTTQEPLKPKPIPKQGDMGYKLLTLNQNRLTDFYKLIELRNGNIEMRNILTYDFAFILSLMTEDEHEVVIQTQKFNTNYDDPQPISEVARTASRAFKDGREFWTAYLNNGYTMLGLTKDRDGLKKPKNNSTIIREQSITADEMKHLSTLISKEESYSRKVAKRRAQGIVARSEYDAGRLSKKAERQAKIQEALQQQPKLSQRELGRLLDVSPVTIGRDLKEMGV